MKQSHHDIAVDWPAEPFGRRAIAPIIQRMIAYVHAGKVNIRRRLLSSLARRIVLKYAKLPVDLVADELRLRCQLVDNFSERKFVFRPWRFDRPELEALSKALPADGIFIDIGANVGLYTLKAARCLGDSGRILAFEPNPITYARLEFNVGANRDLIGDTKLELLTYGIADEECSFQLHLDDHNLGACSIVEKESSTTQDVVEIKCRPLLDVLTEYGIERIDALKIDIEGAEDVAMMPFIEEAQLDLLPRVLIIENSQDQWKRDLFGAMQARGYRRELQTRLNSVFRLDSTGG